MSDQPEAGTTAGRGGRVKGSDLVVEQLLKQGVREFFHVIGGPMTSVIVGAIEAGLRDIGVRDERAGAYAAIALSRVTRRPAVVMGCSGPGTINTVPGVAHAQADGSPLIVLGGAASALRRSTGLFQETDQVAVMHPITKWAHQVTQAEEIPGIIARAFQIAISGAPGPVYVELPADPLYEEIDASVLPPDAGARRPLPRAMADPALVSQAIDLLQHARRPVVIAGSGVHWSGAERELKAFIEAAGLPFYTTPMSAGMVPEDHPLSFQAARSTAFREADCIVVVGTRDNYILNYLQPPVISRDSTVVQLNANPEDLSHNRMADVGILADAKLGLAQLSAEIVRRGARPSCAGWTARLDELNAAARERARREGRSSSEGGVHPYQLARILRQMSPRDAVMVLDGRETLAFGRRAVESYVPAGLLNPGTYGTMGVGVPYALGAKLAVGRRPVVALLGDGAFGYHALELDTAVRHKIGFVCVVANNGGWTGARHRPGHALEYSAYHNLSTVFGCWGASVACEQELEPVLKEAFDYVKAESKPAVVNVITSSARANSRPRDFRLNAAKDEYAET